MSTNDALNRINVAVCALADVDLSSWSEEAMRESIDQLSSVLCAMDSHLARLAEAVRARGFTIAEAPAAGGEAPGKAGEVLATAA